MNKKVIIIDDEQELLELFEFFLEREGIDAKYIVDPLEALDLIRNEKFDLICSDIKMPGLSGLQLLEKIQSEAIEYGKFIFLSAYKDLSSVDVKDMGAEDIHYKPLSGHDFVETIKKYYDDAS